MMRFEPLQCFFCGDGLTSRQEICGDETCQAFAIPPRNKLNRKINWRIWSLGSAVPRFERTHHDFFDAVTRELNMQLSVAIRLSTAGRTKALFVHRAGSAKKVSFQVQGGVVVSRELDGLSDMQMATLFAIMDDVQVADESIHGRTNQALNIFLLIVVRSSL